MNDLANFDPIKVGNEIAALETEAQKDFTTAKAKYEPEAALFTSRSEIIAAKLWDVSQHHPEHLDEVCAAAATAAPLVTGKASKQPKSSKGTAKPEPIKSATALAEIEAFTKHWFPLLNERDQVKAEKLVAKRFEQARANRRRSKEKAAV